MAIKRYIADADTTITNAYKENLSTLGTGANMGASDSLEVFSIWGQMSSSAEGPSVEASRALVKFPVSSIAADRTAGDIPASGSVNFYVKFSNAEHPNTLPSNYVLNILPLSQSWDEGYGLDMETYMDAGVANWLTASSGASWTDDPATASLLFYPTDAGTFALDDFDGETITIVSTDGTSITYTFDKLVTGTDGVNAPTIGMLTLGANSSVLALNVQAAIEHENGHNGKITVVRNPNTKLTLTQAVEGANGNTTITKSATLSDDNMKINSVAGTTGNFSGGTDAPGGMYHTASAALAAADSATNTKNIYTMYTSPIGDDGTKDIEIDISELVEQWIDSTKANYGVGIMMSGAYEDGTLNASYYTKKFFGRGSEYFYKRPYIEARWDSSLNDDSTNFYASSSLASAADNLNTLYLYNTIRGQLSDIEALGANQSTSTKLHVRIHPGLGIDAKTHPIGGGVTVTDKTDITASWTSTGIYSASFAFTGSERNQSIYPVWQTTAGVELYSGSAITVKDFSTAIINPNPNYVTSMVGFRSAYSKKETARFRLFIRKQNWSPTIYTKATETLDSEIINSGFYKLFRVSDNFEVIPYGTGSTNHTKLSYDRSGSYFDLDMSVLEADFAYGLNFVYYLNGKYVEQPEIFKFRVEE